jgi:hypothetical protein
MAMLDIAYIRTNPGKVKLAAEQKLMDVDIDRSYHKRLPK